MKLPTIIQGGMGVAISDWRLAKTVSELGQLGVVSGTGIGRVMVSRLGDGDPEGHTRRALATFPFQDWIEKIVDRYFVPGGKAPNVPYKSMPVWSMNPPKILNALTAIASYVEVFLAKEGHNGVVGINLLEKVQMPNLASLYGAMLAGVDFVIMGAGIPIQVAGVLDRFAKHEKATYRVDVVGADPNADDYRMVFEPEDIFPGITEKLGDIKRPQFFPIISSFVLAQALLKRSEGRIDGFVIETPIAGGHNAPPRGPLKLNELGEPIYSEKDVVDLAKMRELGLPFYLAGGYASAEALQHALDEGATGIQVGTAFAMCNESGMKASIREKLWQKVLAGTIRVFTSPVASPTGFPFKLAPLEDTMADKEVYNQRNRICDLGFLRTLYKQEDGSVGFRCPAEPVEDFVKKGGKEEDTAGRTCLCNNLAATAGFAQYRRQWDYEEKAIITAGDDLVNVGRFLKPGETTYSAKDVIDQLLEGVQLPVVAIAG